MRLVLDTDVVVAAMRSPSGASAEILRFIRREQVTLLLSTAMMLEYDAVCTRPEHLSAADLSTKDAEEFLNAIAFLAKPVEIHFRWRPQLRDPNDEIILETAINGNADHIVTFNIKHYGNAPAAFGIEVLRPADVIRRIRQ
jgi:putative PIN family toxin of toxin-antitoxin system